MPNRGHEADVDLGALVQTAKGLAHSARLRLLAMLAGGELCVCQMIAILKLAPSTVSQHLSVLSRGGLVVERKTGKLVFYRLRDDSGAAALLPPLLELLAADSTVESDRAVAARLRQVPVAILCAADLNLEAVGVRDELARPVERFLREEGVVDQSAGLESSSQKGRATP